ncbi:uncharacterized protein KGF55_002270 [Candida pseudojiufengensis]|uniref:uncharacterized protein n=1 Tax=Candida pseudojiufengensis TaxID=497109 RepID=UPI002225917E|nr:uncharacterized protein KGF55_002270 [Candida pseudojiufengensis]KAI5964328.1 hypothetical protein KGF55_002270 [Candida pseudojiufengensis]
MMEQLNDLPLLPIEIIHKIINNLITIPNSQYPFQYNHINYLLNLPIINTYIAEFIYPILEIDSKSYFRKSYKLNNSDNENKEITKKFRSTYQLIRFLKKLKYIPNKINCNLKEALELVESDLFQRDTTLLNKIKFEISIDENDDLESIRRFIKFTPNAYKLNLIGETKFDQELLINLSHLDLCYDCNYWLELPSTLQSLTIFNSTFHKYQAPNNLIKIKLINTNPNIIHLPTTIKEIQIEELKVNIQNIQLSQYHFLKSFSYKGNLDSKRILQLSKFEIPYTIENLSIQCSNIYGLDNILKYEKLKKLKIIDCPNLSLFFKYKFPDNLEELEFSFINCQLIIPRENFFISDFLIPNDFSPLQTFQDRSGNYLLVDKDFKLPLSLKKLILKNLSYVCLGIELYLPNLKELYLKNLSNYKIEKILYNSHHNLPKLNKLTISNCGIDEIRDVKFPPNLTFLDLSQNRIKLIKDTNLKQLRNLKIISFFKHSFSTNNDFEIPTVLNELDLSFSFMREFNFQNYQNLFNLNINIKNDFNWKDLPPNLQFINIIFQGSKINGSLSTYKNLKSIEIISWFKRCEFDKNCFSKFEELKSLHNLSLSGVNLNNIDLKLPSNLRNLNIIHSINDKNHNSFNLKDCQLLESIKLSNLNFINEFNFNDLPITLEKLELINIQFNEISGNLNHLLNLQLLNLTNSFNETLQLRLNFPKSLNILILNFNQLDYIYILNKIINCPNLESLHLIRSSIISKSFHNLTPLEKQQYSINQFESFTKEKYFNEFGITKEIKLLNNIFKLTYLSTPLNFFIYDILKNCKKLKDIYLVDTIANLLQSGFNNDIIKGEYQ